MIVAIPAFRVAIGIVAHVEEAFQRRPRLVDGAPGFLGSAAHNQSHEFIPKGLKLDSSFTQILEMKCLAGEWPTNNFYAEQRITQGYRLSYRTPVDDI